MEEGYAIPFVEEQCPLCDVAAALLVQVHLVAFTLWHFHSGNKLAQEGTTRPDRGCSMV